MFSSFSFDWSSTYCDEILPDETKQREIYIFLARWNLCTKDNNSTGTVSVRQNSVPLIQSYLNEIILAWPLFPIRTLSQTVSSHCHSHVGHTRVCPVSYTNVLEIHGVDRDNTCDFIALTVKQQHTHPFQSRLKYFCTFWDITCYCLWACVVVLPLKRWSREYGMFFKQFPGFFCRYSVILAFQSVRNDSVIHDNLAGSIPDTCFCLGKYRFCVTDMLCWP